MTVPGNGKDVKIDPCDVKPTFQDISVLWQQKTRWMRHLPVSIGINLSPEVERAVYRTNGR